MPGRCTGAAGGRGRPRHPGRCTESRAGDIVLAIHELAVNAIRHGAGRGRLLIREHDGALHCQVTDDGPPQAASPAQDRKHRPLPQMMPRGPASMATGCGWPARSLTKSACNLAPAAPSPPPPSPSQTPRQPQPAPRSRWIGGQQPVQPRPDELQHQPGRHNNPQIDALRRTQQHG